MNDFGFGALMEKNINPMVDFNYDIPKKTNRRRSVFEMFSPKIKRKKDYNDNPKELFQANKKINSILFKNLKTIYDENKNDIAKDTPIFDNVNCLIQKNTDNNKILYKQILNNRNHDNDNNKFFRKESYNTFISNISENDFRDTEIIHNIDKLKNNNLFRTSIKNKDLFKKHLNNYHTKNTVLLFGSNHTDTRISTNKKEKKVLAKRNSSLLNNFKYNKRGSSFSRNEEELNKLKDKIIKGKSIVTKSRYSKLFTPKNQNRINDIKTPKNKNKKSLFGSRNNGMPKIVKKRYSLKMVENNRFNLDSNLKETRHSVFLNKTPRNMQIPTLNQIHHAMAKTLIQSKIESTRKQLDEHDNNEISEIINKLPKNKKEFQL